MKRTVLPAAIVGLMTFVLCGCGSNEEAVVPKTDKPRPVARPGEQKEAAPKFDIEKVGGKIEVYENAQKRPTIRLNFSGGTIADAELDQLKGLPFQALDLSGTKVTDGGLAHLKDLTQLQELILDRTPVTDAGLEHFKGLTQLQTLCIRGTKVTDAGADNLRKVLPALTIAR